MRMGSVIATGLGCILAASVFAFQAFPQETGTPGGAVDLPGNLARQIEADWLDQDEAFAQKLFAEDVPVNEEGVSTRQDAAGGCDGEKTGRFGFHTASNEIDPWWQVDLGSSKTLSKVVVYNRTDGKSAARTCNVRIVASDDPPNRAPGPAGFDVVYEHNGEPFYGASENAPLIVDFSDREVSARVLRLLVPGKCSFALDEIEVYAKEAPGINIALGRPADQKSVGPHSRAHVQDGTDSAIPAPPSETRFCIAHTRAVIARGRSLIDRLSHTVPVPGLETCRRRFDLTAAAADALEANGTASLDARKAVYLDARRALRAAACLNPLLDIDRLLFIKRHDPGGLFHMVHQYYGFCQNPGGGLFVLHKPLSESPRLENLLDGVVVEQGRLAGKPLTPGAFLSPEVSFDGESVLFAYSECNGEGIEWSPRASFHIFRAGADGKGLAQLTDGPWNEFDPCFLPNGRIVFISERRGGYLRCGGSAPPYDSPTYTLHSMAPDGSDIICLSFHETQEWQPSITHDGMILYTRWDYVDRDTNAAHHVWTCYPDGRDPRSSHGNYPTRREDRPWMEMNARAVPGSHEYVATAAAHHGHEFGSLISIDPRIEDDGAMSQITRLTPDVPFPESEVPIPEMRTAMVYGTPWPLSEDDYLCVYDRHAKNRGIYWIDRFGNRELVYRDPEISCLSPIPLEPRPVPAYIPDATTRTADATDAEGEQATIAVMNVYDSDFEWPEGIRVVSLRIIQVLPKTTPPANTPRIGIAGGTNARAVLGTVPVEEDGSAHFVAPVEKLIYFQALDEKGLAVQSMRSGTYVHPGERLTCLGCHEKKHRAGMDAARAPLALQRAPSPIAPEAEGSNPFNYVRLVQPVLDRHCVECHEREQAIALTGTVTGEHGWTESYQSLAKRYGFYFDSSKGCISRETHGGSRTIPGKFGTHAAPLRHYLDEAHYGVRLSPEEFHRVALWLDCNSEFYGAYENTEAQSRGEAVQPTLD